MRASFATLAPSIALVALAVTACAIETKPEDEEGTGGVGGSAAGSGGAGGSAGANGASGGVGGASGGGGGAGAMGGATTGGSAGMSVGGAGGVGTGGVGGVGTGGFAGAGAGGVGGTPAAGGMGGVDTGGTAGMSTGGSAGDPAGGAGGVGTGGSSGSAGMGATGGSGGSTGTGGGKFGTVEDPGAGCTVGAMPAFSSLTANAKMPDPFKKMDGTRITTKAEWACRREEILKMAQTFIYGEKPVPPKDAVSGTVSNSSISVKVTGPMGMASFTLSVNMNGATAPAPAIIGYGGFSGMPVPSGVATINFTANETTGGSGAKSGAFYNAYGTNHAAGYLTAQAWQISRVLDLLEQNPGVIDPKRVGVTGCSRWGKGAFVAGVLDNRIALTIPVESGLGGTIGLRLVEQLDSYGGAEWPYHGISYVRWMSEVALGQFTTGNSAGADNTDKLPVDMHEMMGLIAPRGLYVVDNPSTTYNGLDRNSAWVTANIGKMIFTALGVPDNMTYQGAGGTHCQWRSQYTAKLTAMVDKFLKGNTSAMTGGFATDLPNPPDHMARIDWTPPTLSGNLE